jgi:3-methyladenine DNA glycosylase/8-oxoguanine DNA glycosylase
VSEVHGQWAIDGPLHLGRTLTVMEMWGATTWLRTEGPHEAWYAQWEREGPGTVHLVVQGDQLFAEGYGPGGESLLARAPELAGLGRPGLERVEARHGVVRHAQKALAGLRVGRSGQVYQRLVSAALAQKVTGKNSKAALRALVAAHGVDAPGPSVGLRLVPPPKVLARLPYYALHPLNIERHRADLVVRIASRASALQRALTMGFGEGHAHLCKLRGIGPWTAGIAMGSAAGDADAVPVGDAKLPGIIGHHLAGERDADDARMLELLAPYAGQRGLVARAVKVAGGAAPRRGPKATVRNIRDH